MVPLVIVRRFIWIFFALINIYFFQGSAPVTGLSDTSSESEDSVMELNGNHDMVDLSKMEKIFVTGVLDELKVCVSYSYQVSVIWNSIESYLAKSQI